MLDRPKPLLDLEAMLLDRDAGSSLHHQQGVSQGCRVQKFLEAIFL